MSTTSVAMESIVATERLLLREVSDDDLDFIVALRGDPVVMEHYPKTLDRDECREFIARQRERYRVDGHGLWLVEDRASGEPRGMVGLLMQTIDGERIPEIGYMILRAFWRGGLATESARGVREHAFDMLGYPRVISLIRPVNIPSQGVARKLGMKPWKLTTHSGLEHIVFTQTREERDSLRA